MRQLASEKSIKIMPTCARAMGSPGGTTIINTVLQLILNIVDHNMKLTESIYAPRIHRGLTPDIVLMEEGFLNSDEYKKFKELRYTIYDEEYCKADTRLYSKPQLGTAMGIQIDWETGMKYGCADSRSGDPSAFSLALARIGRVHE